MTDLLSAKINAMTSYVEKQTTFTELQITSSTLESDISAFLGSGTDHGVNLYLYDSRITDVTAWNLRYFVGSTVFDLVGSPNWYIRAEWDSRGKIAGVSVSPSSLASDLGYSAV